MKERRRRDGTRERKRKVAKGEERSEHLLNWMSRQERGEEGKKKAPREAWRQDSSSRPFLCLILDLKYSSSVYLKNQATSPNLLPFFPNLFASSDTYFIYITWRSGQQYLLFKLKYLVWNLSWQSRNALLWLWISWRAVGEMGPGRWMLRLLANYILTTRIPPCGFSWIQACFPGIRWSHPQSSHIPAQGTGAMSPGKHSIWHNTWRVLWNESRIQKMIGYHFIVFILWFLRVHLRVGFLFCGDIARIWGDWCSEILPIIESESHLRFDLYQDNNLSLKKEHFKVESGMSSDFLGLPRWHKW